MRPILLLVPLIGFLAGCGDEPAAQPQAEQQPPKSDQQRRIDNTEAASAVGYDGAALKRSVQGVVDTNQRHNDETQEAAEAAGMADPDASK